MTEYTIRFATLDEIPVIVHHRFSMFAEMDSGTPETREAMRVLSAEWIREKMEQGRYLGFLAVDEAGQIAAGAGLWLMEWIPGPLDLTDRRAYILNVYTEPPHRGRGLARRLVQAALDWSREHGLETAILHASNAGYPIYKSIGFQASNEMRFPVAAKAASNA